MIQRKQPVEAYRRFINFIMHFFVGFFFLASSAIVVATTANQLFRSITKVQCYNVECLNRASKDAMLFTFANCKYCVCIAFNPVMRVNGKNGREREKCALRLKCLLFHHRLLYKQQEKKLFPSRFWAVEYICTCSMPFSSFFSARFWWNAVVFNCWCSSSYIIIIVIQALFVRSAFILLPSVIAHARVKE